jgi:hypothetical protein
MVRCGCGWCRTRRGTRTAAGRYVGGADVATGAVDSSGRGASNSSLKIADLETGEEIAEFTVSGMSPQDFGKQSAAICRWFTGSDGNPAFLAWEANGPGVLFQRGVEEAGFDHYFRRRTNEQSTRKRVTDVPGWYSTRDSKRTLLGNFARAIRDRSYVLRSLETVNDARMYVYTATGQVAHSRSVDSVDPTGARENHGDRVIGSALCSFLRSDRGQAQFTTKRAEPEAPMNSIMGRRQARWARRQRENKW